MPDFSAPIKGQDAFDARLRASLEKARGDAERARVAEANPPAVAEQDEFHKRLEAQMATMRPQDASDGAAPSEGGAPRSDQGDPADDSDAGAPGADATGPGPVGTGEHVVRQGECISSIARKTGHFWETVWDDPGNAQLRAVRKDPNVLLPKDRVHVPALRPKSEPGQSEMRHRFRRKGQPEVLRLRILNDDQPRGNEPYELVVDGVTHTGVTDAGGNIACPIPATARRASLRVGEESDALEYEFSLGRIDPISEVSGVQGRLSNLGFDCGAADGRLDKRMRRALRKYQKQRGLPVTGEPDEATRRKLQEEYGC